VNNPFEPDGFLNQQAAAKYTGLSDWVLGSMRRRGELTGYRHPADGSRRVLYRVEDLDALRRTDNGEPVPLPVPTIKHRPGSKAAARAGVGS
jgi:hypothetical protein